MKCINPRPKVGHVLNQGFHYLNYRPDVYTENLFYNS
jgi:hypothetical protein